MAKFAGLFELGRDALTEDDVSTVLGLLEDNLDEELSVARGPRILMAGFSQLGRLAAESFPKSLKDCGASVCHWDGRLDNRSELIDRTGLRPSDNPSDSAIVLAIYAAEGDRCFGRLIGDWSLALWDYEQEALYLASDFAGIRGLYYHQTPQRFIWSSSLRHLAAAVDATPEPDDGYILNFLTLGAGGERTPCKGVFAVPPGHSIRVSRQGTRTNRFWSVPIETMIRYPQESGYEEHFRHLFQEAVTARMRTGGPVCAELSGGLDSSSVVSMAHAVRGATAETASELLTISYHENGSNDAKFIKAVETILDVPGLSMELRPEHFISAGTPGNAQPSWWELRLDEVAAQMAGRGSQVLLSGCLGDLVMGNWFDGSEQIAESMVRLNFRDMMRRAVSWSRCERKPVYDLLWEAFRSNWLPTRRSQELETSGFTPEFRGRLERLRSDHGAEVKSHVPPSHRRARALMEILASRRLQSPEALQTAHYTHPFAHRPLVDFMFQIPTDIVYRPGEPRRLMRRALAGIVPDAVLRRRSKAAYGATYRSALVPLAGELLEAPFIDLVEGGWIDGSSLKTRLGRYLTGLDCNEGQLRQIILLEFWIRKKKTSVNTPQMRTFVTS